MFPWYLILRYKIKTGTAVAPKDGAERMLPPNLTRQPTPVERLACISTFLARRGRVFSFGSIRVLIYEHMEQRLVWIYLAVA